MRNIRYKPDDSILLSTLMLVLLVFNGIYLFNARSNSITDRSPALSDKKLGDKNSALILAKDYYNPYTGAQIDLAVTPVNVDKLQFSMSSMSFYGNPFDGEATAQRLEKDSSKIGAFPAILLCADLRVSNHDDWYLPSVGELEFFRKNSLSIKKSDNSFHGSYWTSTFNDADSATVLDMDSGLVAKAKISEMNKVLCFRKVSHF